MIPLTPDEVLSPLGARISRPEPRPPVSLPSGVSTDSRTIRPGECFVAIKGPRFDGHDFIPQAIARGASWVIHASTWCPETLGLNASGAVFLEVDRTDLALQQLAAYVRHKWGGPVIAVTGSMGKTSTRAFTAQLLSGAYRVLESQGNFNNEVGLPLTLLRLEPTHQVAVVELGMNHGGEIAQLAAICAPQVAVITNVAAVHLEFFRDIDEIAAAKGEIIQHLAADGVLVFNTDDLRVAALAAKSPHRTRSFGLHPEADVSIQDLTIESLQRMTFTVRSEGRSVKAALPFAGYHYLYNLAAALAVAGEYHLSIESLAAQFDQLKPASQRGRILKATARDEGEFTIWDDSYNSNPSAVASVLKTLKQLPGYRRKIVVLGEMRELGEASTQLHYQTGRNAVASGATFVWAVGTEARAIAEGALAAGMEAQRVAWFSDSSAAGQALAAEVQTGDLVLCKGSRGVQMERAVEQLVQREGACEA